MPFSKRVHRLAAVVAFALLVVAQAAQAKTFAWKATGKGGTIYLMGSIHVMSESFYPLNPALEAAFKDSDLLVEEVDLARDARPDGADEHPDARHAAVEPVARQGALAGDACARPESDAAISAPPAGPLMRFKPWMLAITLQGMELHEGRLRSGARASISISTIRRRTAAKRSRGSKRSSTRSRASTR